MYTSPKGNSLMSQNYDVQVCYEKLFIVYRWQYENKRYGMER